MAAATLDVDALEVANVDLYLANPQSDEAKAECAKAANSFHKYGLLVVRDSRATEEDNNK